MRLFCPTNSPKPKDIQFTITQDKDMQEFLETGTTECKNDLNYSSIIRYSINGSVVLALITCGAEQFSIIHSFRICLQTDVSELFILSKYLFNLIH